MNLLHEAHISMTSKQKYQLQRRSGHFRFRKAHPKDWHGLSPLIYSLLHRDVRIMAEFVKPTSEGATQACTGVGDEGEQKMFELANPVLNEPMIQ
jgi:hypothetical protein